MTRGSLIAIFIIGFSACVIWVLHVVTLPPAPTLTVHHPTLETVAAATRGNIIKYVALKKGTHVPVDSMYYTASLGHFIPSLLPGEVELVPPPRTLWHPDSCSVRLEVVK